MQNKTSSLSFWRLLGPRVALGLCLGLILLVIYASQQHLTVEKNHPPQDEDSSEAQQQNPTAKKQKDKGGFVAQSTIDRAYAERPDFAESYMTTLRAELGMFPRNYRTLYQLAQGCYAAGQLDEAAEHAQVAVSVRPHEPAPWILLADIQRARGRLDAALIGYQKVVALDRHNALALAGLGQLYVAFGWPQEAVTALEPAVQQAPNDPLLKMSLALAYLQQNNRVASERLLLEVHQLAPENAALWSPLLRIYNDSHRSKEALALADTALTASPSRELPMVLYEKGKALYALQDFSAATATFREALDLQPANPYARYYLALCLQQSKQLPEAAQQLETVLKEAPEHQQARFVLSQVYIHLNRRAEGLRIAQEYQRQQAQAQKRTRAAELVVAHPRSAAAHWQMALIYDKDRNLPLLIVELRKSLELDPNQAKAHSLLKKALRDAGRSS